MKDYRYRTIKNMALWERPREKLIKDGPKGLSDVELLAILIGTGTKEMSAIELARKILSISDEGIRYLGDCTVEELSDIKGVGPGKSCKIIAAIELGKRLAKALPKKKIKIKDPKTVVNLFMQDMRYYKKEYFKTLLLNTKNEIICIEDISIGNLNSSLVHPREVLVGAIRKSASSMILIHNHPSGNVYPSQQDIKITKRLMDASKIIGIEILDHIIIGDGNYISLKEQMMI